MHHFLMIAGVVDEQKVRSKAEEYLKQGEESVVHIHKFGEPCNDKCEYYKLEKDND